jgi:hypothetical protein
VSENKKEKQNGRDEESSEKSSGEESCGKESPREESCLQKLQVSPG